MLKPGEDDNQPPDPSLFEALPSVRRGPGYSPAAVLKGVLGPLPVTVHNYESHDTAACLAATLSAKPFDAVQIETTNLYSYLDVIRTAPGNPAVLFDWHNVDSDLMARYSSETKNFARKLIAKRTAALLFKLEDKVMNLCNTHTVVSAEDREKLLRYNPRANVTVIPNGVDCASFASVQRSGRSNNLLFVGSMDYHANEDAVVWFTRNVWPMVSQQFKGLKFNIVGRSPGREVQMLASDDIRVTGTVDDVRPYYADAMAVVVPLRVGGGTRLKILEAMAMGVPVISTKIGAEGINAEDGRDILLADTPVEMVTALSRLVSDEVFRQELARAARELVSRSYDWSSIGDRLYQVHSEMIASRK